MLALLSAADMVSVYIRGTLVPLATPDGMRGRVLAVEQVFIGASNELGAFESGVAAKFLGTVTAIVTGGIATIAVVVIWWVAFPALRNVDRFEDVVADSATPAGSATSRAIRHRLPPLRPPVQPRDIDES